MLEMKTALITASIFVCVGVIFKGFLSAAGRDLWAYSKKKISGYLERELEVDSGFKAKVYAIQNCTWIPEENIENKENQKWKYYPHPKNGKKCFRLIGEGKFAKKEYFMVTPNANKI